MKRVHGPQCRCAPCRHERFNPGPATSGRRLTFYGHFSRKLVRRRHEIDEHLKSIKDGAKLPPMLRWMRRVVAALVGTP